MCRVSISSLTVPSLSDQAGLVILAVDDRSLIGASHPEAVNVIRKAYNDKSNPIMKIKLQKTKRR